MFKLSTIPLFLVTSLTVLAACDPEPQPAAEQDGTARHPIGKADLAGSCEGACGGMSAGNCWCDDFCTAFGDCCADVDDACGVPTPTCEALGGECKIPSPDACGDGVSVDGTCELANDFCCVPAGPPSCESLGGECKIPSPDACGDGISVDAACELANDFCCVPPGDGDSGNAETCEDLGGQCRIPSPEGCGDQTSVDAPCELANDFCCV